MINNRTESSIQWRTNKILLWLTATHTHTHTQTRALVYIYIYSATYENGNKIDRQLLAQGDHYKYCQMSERNSRHIFEGHIEFLTVCDKLLFIYSTIPCGIPENVLRNLGTVVGKRCGRWLLLSSLKRLIVSIQLMLTFSGRKVRNPLQVN